MLNILALLVIAVAASSAVAQPVQPDPNGNCYHALPSGKDAGSLTEQQIRDGHYVARSASLKMCPDRKP